ncbi:MAG: prolipoprotein diacylglyceryl transferase [Fimbriimonas sp.]|nr:prolipoprotein diacylglyceryl transferase [Fimbriimonas sp.]
MLPIFFTVPKLHLGSFALGPIPIHSYGVMLIIGFLAGMWLVRRRAHLYGFLPDKVIDMGFWALIAGVLGARIAFILQDLPDYLKNPRELFSPQFNGLTSFGGEILAVIAIVLWARRNKYSIVSILDLAAPGYLLGYAIGRVGCFLNGCCYGGVCSPSLPWATKFHDAVGYHHPAQLYDSLMNLAALGVLLWLGRKKLLPGRMAATMLMLHGFARFVYEFWRAGTDDEVRRGLASSTYWGTLPITQGHAMALALIAIGVVWYFLAGRKAEIPAHPETPEMKAA